MLFNSLEFAVFLPIVFLLYWLTPSTWIRARNFSLLVASYIFYGWWDYKFLGLIFLSTILDYLVGLRLDKVSSQVNRKILLGISLVVNLGLLFVFKYFNFFIESFVTAFSFFGHDFSIQTVSIVLPVGISFYTFQTLSYTIDVYRKDLRSHKSLLEFATYVSFFPQLVAGPIERATNLLPQFSQTHHFSFEDGQAGLRQILWGLFKKVVIADTCATQANLIFGNPEGYGSITLILGAVYFAFQIYGDFSGYSDIAIGTARLFGFRLMRNFSFPYFSRDIAEFWRRWHISLSTWFRDYLYIPLGGSRGTTWRAIRNILIIFLVSGFWHGANWTFIVWGGLNALFFLPLYIGKSNRQNLEIVAKGKLLPSFREVWKILSTFCLTVLAWVFFRAESMTQAWHFFKGIFSFRLFPFHLELYYYIPLILVLLVWEWLMREKEHGLDFTLPQTPVYVRWSSYIALIWSIGYSFGEEQEFIYFQF